MTLVRRLLAEERERQAAYASVDRLRDTAWQLSVITTGACGELLSQLWGPPNASSNLLAHRFSYAQEETVEILGHCPEKFADQRTACFLATAAYYQGRKLAVERGKSENDVLGVGMTSKVTTGRVRNGEDAVYVATRSRDGIQTVSAYLDKPDDHARDARSHRVEQGRRADLITLDAILAATVRGQVPVDPVGIHCEELQPNGCFLPKKLPLSDVLRDAPFNWVHWPDGTVSMPQELTADKYILFPGSFAPITHAHDEIARLLERTTGKKVVFQISLAHPVKKLTRADLVARAAQMRYRWPVVLLEGAGLYVEKAEVFPGMEMLIGADVVESLFQESHYGGYDQMVAAMDRVRALGTTFHVNGREVNGRYKELADIPVPGKYAGLFRPMSLRYDVSSSARRAAGAKV